ncbi:MAG: FKBP-type peptidyl-prolyl cis-trans isomerase [Cryobacterium sp.]|uniref:FKBP-type peptidyl-prolyl cis-trans isomerase n=1 Tax=unclassified Cryobacterium TaxID=2649013 RepID=UPI001A332516|nr:MULTISPECIES: FKBP-type peptidyl-prolyl cis-trans isomerase [unclassified Cryobacterium]MCY7403494.1 FKBP-type peptidyl-prolyl cis-trans isomerase [Cryobacterium sp.]MEC5152704.1 FKBP-type peptidyl-prolyl cis-trans isomerase [Cryobacterium sp. CAN_C3]
MSKIPAFLTIVGLTLALTACGGSGTPTATDAAPAADTAYAKCTSPGKVSDSVGVTGDFGGVPTVDFAKPLKPTATQRTVAIKGSGTTKASGGSLVAASLSVYNGTTGAVVQETKYPTDGSSQTITVGETFLPGLVRAANCSVEGDRIVAVSTTEDAFGTKGASKIGIAAGDSVVFVIDVISVTNLADRANGVDQPPVDGLPTVKLADNGAPTITVPDAAAPTELKIAPLKLGDGAVVADGDTVSVEYTGVIWGSGKTFDSSWKTVGPVTFVTSQVVPGFGAALVGQTVGSQVLAVLPPAEGYGEAGNDSAGIKGTDTLVFVVDIVGTAATPAA